ncbi:MAG: signal peptidase II [Actinomycetota bacterium]|jgi:signal peptidase II|nr:signal peptidase II [Sporichthyaceae bacterium]MDQ3112854.1 signal peptidase II [Actinomycetota bacterium]MDQ3449603.1 signal peptidase II [Actinomycetota bacterium]
MQAARGTPLSLPPGECAPTAGRFRIRLVLALAAALVLVDQVTKVVAVSALTDRAPIELLGGVLTLRLVRNAGAAFGLAAGFTVVLTVVAVLVSVVIVRVARRLTSRAWAIALGLLLGGAIGNLIDRLFRPPGPLEGHVVDFLELPNWPVFNVADSSIVCAGALMVVLTFRGVPVDDTQVDGTQVHRGQVDDRPSDAASG